MAQGKLIDFLNYYAGPGAYVIIAGGNQVAGTENVIFNGGFRVPMGLNAYLLNKTFEFFIELAPAFGVQMGSGTTEFQFPTIGLQGAVGFRFWFK